VGKPTSFWASLYDLVWKVATIRSTEVAERTASRRVESCIIMQGIGSQYLGCKKQGPDAERSSTTTLITSEKSKMVIKTTPQLFRNKKRA